MLNIIHLFWGCELCVRVVGCELFWSRLAGNSIQGNVADLEAVFLHGWSQLCLGHNYAHPLIFTERECTQFQCLVQFKKFS